MDGRFEEFLRERKYLLNVSEATLYWYRASFKAWEKNKSRYVFKVSGVTDSRLAVSRLERNLSFSTGITSETGAVAGVAMTGEGVLPSGFNFDLGITGGNGFCRNPEAIYFYHPILPRIVGV